MIDKQQIEEAAKQIFRDNAHKGMMVFKETGFIRKFPTLYGVIIKSISAALSQPKDLPKSQVEILKEDNSELYDTKDMEEIREECEVKMLKLIEEHNLLRYNDVFNIFLPYLQPQQSDAIEFSEWTYQNHYIFYNNKKCWYFEHPSGLVDVNIKHTTEELYKLFKETQKLIRRANVVLLLTVAIGEVKAYHQCSRLALHLMAFILPIACYAFGLYRTDLID